jgi:uncharacterized protein
VPEKRAPGVYIEEVPSGSKPIEGVGTAVAAFIGLAPQGPHGKAMHLTSFLDYERAFGGLQSNFELGYGVRLFFENGGADAWVVRVTDLADVANALAAFDSVDTIGLLCVPGCVDAAAVQAALAYSDRRRAFLVVDPSGSDAQATQDLAATLRATESSKAAVYFPRLMVADPLAAGAPRPTAPSGAVAGLIARTDAVSGVWKPPAGLQGRLVGLLGLERAIDDLTTESLADAGVNAIRSIPGSGPVLWGARTVSLDDEWKYVSVRRLTLFIEESIDRGLQWAVFEPNDEALWLQLRASVTAFLTRLWREGGLPGSKSREAFAVRCGRDTMTQADLDQGRVVIVVGFAPLKPAEFVVIRIGIWLASSSDDRRPAESSD